MDVATRYADPLRNGATLSLECSWALNIVENEYYRIWVAGDRAGAEVTLGRTEALRLRTWVDPPPRHPADGAGKAAGKHVVLREGQPA